MTSSNSGDSVSPLILQRRAWSRARQSFTLLAALFALSNCGGGSDAPTTPPEQVASVVISGVPTENVLVTGATAQLAAQPRSAGGQTLDRSVTWQSSDLTVATVSPTGLVAGLTPGPVTVTASAEGRTASVLLSVRSPVTVPPATATEPVTTTVLGGAVTLTIPPAATMTTAQLTVAPAAAPPTDNRVLGGTTFVFGPVGTQFTTPITLQLAFNPAAVPPGKVEDLRIYLVESNGTLTLLPGGSVDVANNKVQAPVNHFSTYTIVVPADPASVAVSTGNNQTAGVGQAVAVAPAVLVRDAQNRPVPFADVTFSVTAGGGSLSGATSVETNEQGIATLPGTWTLGATPGSNTLRAAVDGTQLSTTFAATATAPATQLFLLTEPASALSGVVFGSPIVVEVRNAFDGVVTTSTAAVTAELVSGSGTLVGTTTVNAASGLAQFNNLRIDGVGQFRIRVTAAGLAPDTTPVIDVTQRVASLSIVTQPGGATSNAAFATQPVVELRDDAGLRVVNATTPVSVTRASGSGTLYGPLTQSAVDGTVTFSGLAIEGSGSHTLAFAAAGAPSVTSAAFTVAALPPGIRLLVGASPAAATVAGQTIALPLVVDLSNRGADDLAAITVRVEWDATRFEFVSDAAGAWQDASGAAATVVVNDSETASGTYTVSGFTTGATTQSFTLRTLTLRALTVPGSTQASVSATVTAAGNAAGSAVTVAPRPTLVTIEPTP